MDDEKRTLLVGLANSEIDKLVARLTGAGMPGVGICAVLVVRYAALARETGASIKQAVEVAAERIAIEYGGEAQTARDELLEDGQKGAAVVTREEALEKAIADALAHHRQATTFCSGRATTDQHLGGLYAGLRVVREKMAKNRLRSNDLTQIIACALDCLAVAYYDAARDGQEPSPPPPEDLPS